MGLLYGKQVGGTNVWPLLGAKGDAAVSQIVSVVEPHALFWPVPVRDVPSMPLMVQSDPHETKSFSVVCATSLPLQSQSYDGVRVKPSRS